MAKDLNWGHLTKATGEHRRISRFRLAKMTTQPMLRNRRYMLRSSTRLTTSRLILHNLKLQRERPMGWMLVVDTIPGETETDFLRSTSARTIVSST